MNRFPDTLPPKAFTTDGCSDFGLCGILAKLRVIKKGEFDEYCVRHDRAYWKGGSAYSRMLADTRLMLDIYEHRKNSAKHAILAVLYFVAVRIGGHPLLPTPWRWGYGWPYPHRYTLP